jgi:hypothetical protein
MPNSSLSSSRSLSPIDFKKKKAEHSKQVKANKARQNAAKNKKRRQNAAKKKTTGTTVGCTVS